MGLSGGIGALGNSNGIVSHAFHHAFDVIGERFLQDMLTKPNRIMLIFSETGRQAELPVK